ncbi:MAG: nSTAND1 domain-containing NTPase [Nostoc sp.]
MASEWAAIVIGINYYPEYTTLKPLTAAAEDAEKIAQQLEQYGYRPFHAQCLPRTLNQKGESKIDRQGAVKVQELIEAIANLFNPPPPNPIPETALFFFSGHGWCKTVAGKEEVFLATSDVLPDAEIYGIPLSWLGEQLQTSQAKRVVVWLDCCYSGELLNFIPTDKDYCFITATRSYETGLEIPHTQGLLTEALLAGLNPENDADGIVNSHKLADFIISRMSNTVQRPLIANSTRAILLTTKFSQKSFQDKCPYRSLSYFTETKEDAEVFYGRSALTQELIQQVREKHRLIALLGASGSGKSSMLRAGLLYQLKLGQDIPGSDRWTYITPFTPKETPVNSLQEAFALSLPNLSFTPLNPPLSSSGGYTSEITPLNPPLERGETGKSNSLPFTRGGLGRGDLAHVIGEELKALNTPVILIIDQFEECFTMCDDSQRQGFFDCLRELVDYTDNLYIFIGMRSDFRARWREYPEYASRIHKPYINVEHLTREEIEEAITKPADWVGLGIEGRLKQQLINDVEDYPGSLPLLQYTLTELWRESKNQGDEVLSLKTYQDLGGVEGTLQKRADAVYESLSPTEKTVARRIFLELTQIGETTDVRRRVRLGELVNSHHSLEFLQQVSEKLADKDARLITKTDEQDSEDVILDVVHEALIRHWQMLREWKDEYKVGIGIERQIEAEAQEWERNDKKPGFLRKDDRLAVAEAYLTRFGDWQMLNGVAEEYIQKSQELRNRLEREEKERQQEKLAAARRQNRVVILFSMGLAAFAVFAGYQWRQAEINQIRAYRESSKAFLVSNQDLDALINSLQAGIKLNQPLLQIFPFKNEVKRTLQQAVYQAKERNRLVDKDNVVNSVSASFSPNGQLLATAGDDGTVGLWNLQGKKLKSWRGNQRPLYSPSFSPNGQLLATAGEDGTVGLWNLQGQQLKTWQGNQGWIRTISFTPDGQGLVTAGQDGTIRLWNLQGQQLKFWQAHNGWIWKVTFSPDGQRLATAGADNVARIWDLQGKQLAELKGHTYPVRSVSFSPDGQQLATRGDDGTIRLWDLQGKQLKAWKASFQGIWSVSFSPDGQLLVTGGEGGNTDLWDLKGDNVGTLKGYQGPVRSINFSPNGQLLATAGDGNTVRLWNFQGQQLVKLKGHQGYVIGFSFNPNAKQLVTSGQDGTIRLWDLQSQQVQVWPGHQGMITSIRFSPNGQQLASIGDKGMIYLWDLQGRLLKAWQGHQGISRIIKFSPNGQQLLSTDNNMIRLWDLQGQQLKAWQGTQNENILSVSFSPDGKRLATTGDGGNVYLWNLQGQKLQTLTGHPNGTESVSFHPDGQRLATAGDDGTVRLWNLQGKQLEVFTVEQGLIRSVSFSPDGQQFVTIGDEGVARLWDLQGRQLAVFTTSFKNLKIIGAFFSPNNRQLATLEDDGTVKLWQIESFEDLIQRGCNWVQDYLKNNPEVEKSNKDLCNGIGN